VKQRVLPQQRRGPRRLFGLRQLHDRLHRPLGNPYGEGPNGQGTGQNKRIAVQQPLEVRAVGERARAKDAAVRFRHEHLLDDHVMAARPR
jgi:hypothetical protein